jgi:hypothetical protein
VKTFVIAGCSVTSGVGWNENNHFTDAKDDFRLWTNLCHRNIKRFQNLKLLNVGQAGASNSDIFQNAVRVIANNNISIDTMFVQWTSGPRYTFNAGFELWNTSEVLVHGNSPRKHNIKLNNGEYWTREYVHDLTDRLRVLHHLHWEIVKIVDYSSMLSNLAQQKEFDIFFINGICPWDENYFVELHNVTPEEYTAFTKKHIIDIESRSDEDIHKLYHLAHQHYREAGGINQSQWINLYNSFYNLRTDFNFDGSHPGQQSNQTFFNLIKSQLASLNYI